MQLLTVEMMQCNEYCA